MLKYSFMSSYSNCTKEDVINLINTTNKPFKYTYGLKMRGPTTCEVPISREKALEYFEHGGLVDVTEREDFIDVNEYSGNDMW